mgnify:CR=1 FL=1
MWAVGCLLGEMILGKALFDGKSEIECLLKIFRLTGCPKDSDFMDKCSSIIPP